MKLRSQKAMYLSPISIMSVLTIKKSTCKIIKIYIVSEK